jgi:hypothetical protein
VTAIADVMKHQTVLDWRACGPPTVTSRQTVDVVETYLRAHPEIRDLAASSLVAEALAKAFPCPP